MTEANDPAPAAQQPDAVPPPPPPTGAVPAPAYAGQPATMPMGTMGTVGTIRSTGTCILLTIVTLGIYTLVWYFKTHEEMKQHSGTGIGGALALILGLLVGIVMPFITSGEVGGLYERRGQARPVSATTGLWILLPLVGGIVWFVKTNGALNDYWRSVGAQG